MPVERITTMMSARSGLGESGETILVGSDKRMRSNSFRDPEHHGLVASYRNGETGSVDSPLVTAAIARGESGVKSCEDYLGEKVLAAYAPVKIGGLTWCLIAQITESEAFAATYEMRKTTAQALYGMLRSTLITAALVATLLVVAAWYFGEKIALPISQASEFATKIAEGDLTQPCDAVAYGETGELISSMNAMQSGLSRIVQDLRVKATTMSESSHDLMLMSENLASEASEATMTSTSVSAAAEELATNMKVMATQTDDVSADIKSIAVSIEEMTTTIEEIAKSATLSATESQQAEDLVSASSESVGELGRAAGQIASVVEIIQDIADKTNMLALNATIEAARAGDAGKGFAVVACEVKELASQTSQATNDIRKQVEEIQSSTGAVVDSIKAVVDSIASIGDKTRRISAAVEEQSVTTRNISDVITSTALRASSLSSAVEETALASQEITRGVAQVDRMAHQTADAATKTKATGGRLRELSSDAEELVSVFQVSG